MDILVLEVCFCDEQGVLEVDLILLVVGIVNELAVACNAQLTGLCICVGYLCSPYFISSVHRNVVCNLRLYLLVLRGDDSVGCTVTALALVAVEGLAYGRPRSRPEIIVLSILDIYISAGLIVGNSIETVTDNTSVCTGFNEAVAACVV